MRKKQVKSILSTLKNSVVSFYDDSNKVYQCGRCSFVALTRGQHTQHLIAQHRHENLTSATPMCSEDHYGPINVASCNGCERRLHFIMIWPSTNAFKSKNMCQGCDAVWCNTCWKQLKTVRRFRVFKVEFCGSGGSSLGRHGVLDVRIPTG